LKSNNWLSAKQVNNAYFIAMNSQDLDYSYINRTQYNWVKNEIDKAKDLRNEGKIDWIFIGVHKPQYTLKTKHIPEQKARDIYQPIFDKAQVDIVESGH
jgi:Calcineurin-like phosphoesterase